MRRNLALKVAIWASGWTQKEVADRSGVTELRVSQAICGRCTLRDAEQDAIAATLGMSRAGLFGQQTGETQQLTTA